MFSYRLSRLPYAILMYAHGFWSMNQILEGGMDQLILVFCSLPLLFLFVIWPRLRDCDWPFWFGLLLIIPFLGTLMGIALLFAPSKMFGRKDNVERPLEDAGVRQIAGSQCAKCGSTILVASEGIMQGDHVLCTGCHATTLG
jgi:hypothetical protein